MSISGGLTVGSSTSGGISVGGVTTNSSDSLGPLTLVATKITKSVQFVGSDSTFSNPHGLHLYAAHGVYFGKSVSVGGPVTVFAGNTSTDALPANAGIITVSSGYTLATSDSDIQITAVDLDLSGSLDAGSGSAIIHPRVADATVGLGATSGMAMHLDGDELRRLTSTGGLLQRDTLSHP